MRISDSTIEQLNAQADLVAIIRRHTILKPAGREFKGCCPFHGEKTPSFYVNPESNLYYCFGCGAKGNAIRFLVDYERLTFMEAVKTLSEQTGIELPKEDSRQYQYRRNSSPSQSNQSNQNNQSNQSNQSNPNQSSANQSHQSAPTPPAQIDNDGNGNSAPMDNTHNNANGDAAVNHPVFDNPPLAAPFYDAPFDDAYAQHGADVGYDSGYYDASFEPPSFDSPPFEPPPLESAPLQAPLQAPFHDTQSNQAPTSQAPEPNGNLYQLLVAINAYYVQQLHNHPTALRYFLDRGLTPETLATFELGYAPAGWQHPEAAFPHDIEGLKLLGLVRTSQKGRDFDLLRDRVIFPIKDRQGRIVGFAGRALDDDATPKYLNSSDSVVFQKQHILYGYYESRQARARDWLIVEGYMDVIALYQAGIYGAVAPMGTAVNAGQISTLLKFNDALTLCFDGDSAGQKAALRTLEVAMPVLPDGKQLKFLTLSDNHDPDTYIKAYGSDAMQNAIASALPLSDYLFGVMASKYDISRAENKATIMAEVKALSEKLPKGSSFRWWLNGEIYQRLRDKPAFTSRTQTPANYRQGVDSTDWATQLSLCILYQPSLIASDPLARIYQASGLDGAHTPFVERLQALHMPAPVLPRWADLQADGISELIAATINALPHLLPHDGNDERAIDANAHFILASLNNDKLQARLAQHWRSFYQQTHRQGAVALLFDEILCQMISHAIRHAQSTSTHLLITQIHKRRLTLLERWNRDVLKPAVASRGEL